MSAPSYRDVSMLSVDRRECLRACVTMTIGADAQRRARTPVMID
jgi:hypothetical protein